MYEWDTNETYHLPVPSGKCTIEDISLILKVPPKSFIICNSYQYDVSVGNLFLYLSKVENM